MLAKAQLVEIKWDAKQQQANKVPNGKTVEVHFNPQTLRLTYANENKGGDQPGGSAKQFVGSGTSKLAVELVFDTTDTGEDVRRTTADVAYFIQAQKQANQNNKRVPPGISFEWGSFIFRGIVNGMQETLEYFSEEGVPLRATVTLDISRQDIEFIFGTPAPSSGAPSPRSGAPGTQPLTPARQGDSVQKMAGRNGNSGDWKAIAAANNIDDPLRLQAGAMLNLNVGASAGVGISAGAGAGASIGFGAAGGITAGAGAPGAVGFSAGLGGGAGFSAGASAGAGAGIGGSAGIGLSAGAGGGASFGAGASFSGGFSVGGGASFGGGAGASFGATVGGGASFGAGASVTGGAGLSARAGAGGRFGPG